MSTAKIASIYFAPVKEDLSAFGFGVYSMPAVEFGASPLVVEITDKTQHDKGPYNGNRQRQSVSFLHAGASIARSLLNSWSGLGMGMTPDCRPGMWLIREVMPQMSIERRLESGQVVPSEQERDGEGAGIWREATAEEKKAMWDEDLASAKTAQRRYADYLFMQANIMAERPAMIQFIPQVTRLAADYYKRSFDWMKEGASSEEMIACPWCQKRIPPKSIVCQGCSQIVDAPRYAALKQEQEAASEEVLTRPVAPAHAARKGAAMGLQPVGA